MRGKEKIAARVGFYTGLTRLIESLPSRPALLILNYHRIGDAQATPYDSDTFSCTTAEFDWQVGSLKRRFPIVNLEEALDIIHGRAKPLRASVLLTFDDGYRDNFDDAFGVLRAHGASATFFLTTSFVGTNVLPWWDVVAFIVKKTARDRISLDYPERSEFDLTPARRAGSIVKIQEMFKSPSATDPERFMRGLEDACGVKRPAGSAERCFMNWDEARRMQERGMCFGSHSHTHPILSKLPYAGQFEELRTSRQILERELGRTIDTLAYPDGQADTFNEETFKALMEARYSTAFSYYSGMNIPGKIRPYDVLRYSDDGIDRTTWRFRIALRANAWR